MIREEELVDITSSDALAYNSIPTQGVAWSLVENTIVDKHLNAIIASDPDQYAYAVSRRVSSTRCSYEIPHVVSSMSTPQGRHQAAWYLNNEALWRNSVGFDDGCVVNLNDSAGNTDEFVYFQVYGPSKEQALEVASKILRQIEYIDPPDDTVTVRFWNMSQNGPINRYRKIEVPSLEEVISNYPRKIAFELGRLINGNIPQAGGKLILWQGKAGNGKSFAIRTLMREWAKEKVSFDYIIDPDNFFGGHPDYMINVLLGEDDDGVRRLIVLEDAGELLSSDAKQRSGQGLSRLLNSADGMIGQGLNFHLLITTNEEIHTFHPAVIRPGRCLQTLEFHAFSTVESNNWLQRHGSPTRVSDETTLAELYNIINEETLRSDLEERTSQVAGTYL